MNPNLFKVAEVQLIYKTKIKPGELLKIGSSKDAFDIIKNYIDLSEQEHIERVYIILLNRANKVLGINKIADGAQSGCIIDPKIVFQNVLKSNAASFILWHNHSSGNLKPSKADINISEKLKQGSKLLDVSFLDHLIISSDDKFYSLADNGQL